MGPLASPSDDSKLYFLEIVLWDFGGGGKADEISAFICGKVFLFMTFLGNDYYLTMNMQ